MNATIALIIRISSAMQFDPATAVAVAYQESKLDNEAVGALGELGVMQIRPEFVSISNEDLKNVVINITTGISLLKEAKEKCNNKTDLNYLVCYNMGISRGNEIKFPHKNEYVKSVTNLRNYYKEVLNVGSQKNNTYSVQTSGRWYFIEPTSNGDW